MPYNNHKKTPRMKVISIEKETSLADFDCQVLSICGKKALVVNVPAANPRIVTKSGIIVLLYGVGREVESFCSVMVR